MTALKTDESEVRLAIGDVAQQVAGILRQIHDTSRPARGLEWTIGETAAHILAALREHVEFVEGRTTPWPVEDIQAMNRSRIDEIPERNGPQLADLIVESADAFTGAAENRSPGQLFPWFSGHQIDFSLAMGILLGELVIHGRDIATSAGKPWPISQSNACRVISGVCAVLHLYVDGAKAKNVKASYEIRVKNGPRVELRFQHGTVNIGPATGSAVDCHLLVDPVAFMLVAYGRANQWGQIARGKMMAWGRRPWLSIKLKSLLVNP